jgi:nucleoside-diphosphate-sugar epimerase
MKCLVTGAGSGLGAAIYGHFGGVRLQHGDLTAFCRERRDEEFDVIFHCAFNAAKDVTMRSASSYVQDNLFFTNELAMLRHRKFVYISSQDVYPRSLRMRREDAEFDLAGLSGAYPFTKLFSEIAVRQQARAFLICRPATFLGIKMRPNTTSRLLVEPRPRLFLRPESRFNYVLHSDVVRFLEIALQKDLCGIFNVASRGTVRLRDICEDLGLAASFGDYLYDVGEIDVSAAAAHYSGFNKTSADALNEFIDLLGTAFIGQGRVKSRPTYTKSR